MDRSVTLPRPRFEALEVCGSLASAVLIGAVYGALAYASLQFASGSNNIVPFWMGNAVAVGMLLGRGMRCRIASIGLCLLTNIAAYLTVGMTTALALLLAGSNMLEILLALFALDRLVIRSPTSDKSSQSAKLAFAGAMAPFVSGLVSASSVAMLGQGDWLTTFALWITGHSLQIPIFAFALLILRSSVEDRSSIGRTADVTEISAREDAVSESEKRFRRLAETAPVGIFRTDANGDCTYVNAAWKLLTGSEDGQWKKDGWLGAVYPEDRNRIVGIWIETVRTQGKAEEEFRWLRPDGSIIWTQVTFGPEFAENGEFTGYTGVVINITDEVEARSRLAEREQQLALLADNATDAVLRLDPHGICTYASPSARRVLGLDPALLVGNQFITGFHEADADQVVSQFRKLASGGVDNVRISFRSKSPVLPDEYTWLEANCGLVRDEGSGRPLEIIASLRNVDQTKKLENDLREAKERAEAATAAKSDFLANMSHEIRTPMTGVIGFTEVALEGELDEELRSNLEMLADSGKAMLALLDDLLDSAKIDAGRMPVEPQPVDVRQKLRGAITMMAPAAARKGVEIVLEAEDAVPQWIESDPARLRQIALNLIGNAVKFTETGRISVGVRTTEDGDRLEIAVSDTGIGIPQDKFGQIFEKYIQADSSIGRRYGGTGLGLPICAQLAELLGGSIALESEIGMGSVFTLTLPLKAVNAPGKPAQDTRGRRRLSKSVLDARILVAEDNVINQQVTLAMLERLGLSATIAFDGQEAVDRAMAANCTDTPFDSVLMDVQMPVLDGIAATRAIRAAGVDEKHLPIIALTASAYVENFEECRAAGMQDHLPKPLSLDDLAVILDQWLGVSTPRGRPQPVRPLSEKLRRTFSQRKATALEAIDAFADEGAQESFSAGEVATHLHQIAGVAAFFGERDLGEECSRLDQRLRTAPQSVKAPDFSVVRGLLRI